MRRHTRSYSGLWAFTFIAIGTLAACGDNTQSKVCGEGTVDNGEGVCVAGGGGTCGPGTILVGDECVPDGSVICGDGTVFNPATGACDPDVCEAGEVFIDGNCIDESLVDVDAEEAAEPNDGDAAGELAGEIIVPAIGEDGFVIHGCVNPYRDVDGDGNPDTDYDYWLIDAASPMALDITADGVSGLAAGFIMLAGDPELVADGWQRFGINLVNDKSERQLYLPKAGIYVLAMTDSRSLFLDAAGGPDACYYTSVAQIALPAATPGTITDTPGSDDGTLRVISFDPDDGDLFDNLLTENSAQVFSSLTVLKNGVYLTSAAETTDFFGTPIPAEVFSAGYTAGDTLEIVIDSIYNYALVPIDYTLVTTQIGAQALPTAGTDATVTPTGAPFFNVLADLNWLYFDVASAGDVVHFDIDFNGDDANLLIVDADLLIMATVSFPDDPTVPGFGPGAFVRFPTAGRYYAVVFRPGELPADTWTLTSTLIAATPGALAVGTLDDVALPATESAFFTYDGQQVDWASLTASATSGGIEVTAQVYDLAGFGWLDNGYNEIGAYVFDSAGGDVYEHIFLQDTRDFLIRWTVTNPGVSTTFDVTVGDVPYVDLGTVVDGTPFPTATNAFLEDEFTRYVAYASEGSILDITATPNTASPDIDIIMETLAVDYLSAPLLRNVTPYILRADSGFDGDPENLATGVAGMPPFVAFAIGDYFGDPGTVDVDITASSPSNYDVTTGAIAFADACAGGTTLAQTAVGPFGLIGDEAVTADQTIAFPFEHHGAPAPTFYVSTNGFLAFEPSVNDAYFSNTTLPNSAAPNNMLAAYWDDLDGITICRENTATSVTIQWVGFRYGDPTTTVQMQAVLHDDFTIDYIYGATHLANGAAGTVGSEGGGIGLEIVFNGAGDVIAPSSSKTLTPQ
jgi:hypothetical protein